MEFSEISEIEEIITYSKTLKSSLFPKPMRNMQIDDDFFPQQNYIAYDEVMNTSGSLDLEEETKKKGGNAGLNNRLDNMINLNFPVNQETIEILADISNSLTLISAIIVEDNKTENTSESDSSSRNGKIL